MAEYLGKGTGVTLGTLGTIGFGLSLLNGSNGGDGGILGGILGGNGGRTSALMAEVAQLRSEKYADKVGTEVYAQSRRENQDLGDRILGNWVKPIAEEAAANRERLATLEAKVDGNKALQDKENELIRKEIEISKLKLDNKIDVVAINAKNGIDCLGASVAALRSTVDSFMCHKVRKDSICPEVMERYNTWEAPTAAAPNVQPVSGTINVV